MTILRFVTPALLAGLLATVDVSPVNGEASKAMSPDRDQERYVGCVIDEASFARAAGLAVAQNRTSDAVQLILLQTIAGGTSTSGYALTGPHETDLSKYVNSRVEVTGRIEKSSVASSAAVTSGADSPGASATGASGVTPDGSPAHEAGDSTSRATPPRSSPTAATPRTTESGSPKRLAAIAELDRLNVISVRSLGGSCGDALETRGPTSAVPAPAVSSAPESGPRESTAAPPSTPITATGCVVRQSSGNASQPASPLRVQLALTKAAVALATSAASRGVLTGGGAGTATTSADKAGRAANAPERGFLLEGHQSELLPLVGQQVAVTGTVRARVDSGDDERSAHASSPVDTLLVTSVRPGGGTCR
jgi:hypothetical protein